MTWVLAQIHHPVWDLLQMCPHSTIEEHILFYVWFTPIGGLHRLKLTFGIENEPASYIMCMKIISQWKDIPLSCSLTMLWPPQEYNIKPKTAYLLCRNLAIQNPYTLTSPHTHPQDLTN